MQTDPDFEQIIIVDNDGHGVHWANKQISELCGKLNGDYVYILDDDDFIVCENFIKEFKLFIKKSCDIIIVKGWIHEKEFPKTWQAPPERGKIAAPNFIAKRNIFDKYCQYWDIEKRGDFNFINAVYQNSHLFQWWDRFIFYADPSSGKTETQKNVIREMVYY